MKKNYANNQLAKPYAFWHKKIQLAISIILILFLSQWHLWATPPCQIVNQAFANSSDGATSDASSTGWSMSTVSGATYWACQSHRIKAQGLGAVGTWSSAVFNISGRPNVQVQVKVSAEGVLDAATEYVAIYYKLNGGALTLMQKFTGNFGTPDISSVPLNGSTVQIVIQVLNKHNGLNSYYYILNYGLNSQVVGCSLAVAPSVSGTITCATPSVTLSPGANTTSNVTYSWTGPNGFTSTSQNPVVSTSGTYNVTASIAASSSTATGSVLVSQNTTAPGATASETGTLSCIKTSIPLAGSSGTSGVSYRWTGPNSFTSTLQSPSVSTAGTYTLTVTNPTNGCTSTASTTVPQNITAPGATASVSGPLTCTASSVTLTGSSSTSGVTYSWSGSNGLKSTSQNPTVSTVGIDTVTVTNPVNGCKSIANVTVVQNKTAPGATASVSGTLTCSTTSVTILGSSSTSGVSYSWTGPVSFTSNAQNPSVSTPGTYTLTVTNPINGCTSTATITVTQNITSPGATVGETGILTCTTSSASLFGSSSTSGVTYSWTGPNSFTSALQNPAVSASGTYTLTVKNPTNGCTSTGSTTVPQNTTVPGATAGVSGILTCVTTSVTLSGSSSTTGVNYSWTGPNSFTSITQNPSVNAAGVYTLTVTDPANGCTSAATASVAQNMTAPDVSATGASLPCSGSVNITGNSTVNGVTFGWTGPNGFTSTLQNPTVSETGVYTLTVTNLATGCSGSDTAIVIQGLAIPGVSATASGPLTCTTNAVTLSGNAGISEVTYSWTGPGSFTSSMQNPVVSTPGTYTLTVSNPSNGCTSALTVLVAQNLTTPGATSGVSGSLTCVATSVTLSGTSSTSGVSYSWAGPNSFTSSVQNPIASAIGTYTLTVTNPVNGCISTSQVTVTLDKTVPSASASVSGPLTCAIASVSLSGSSTTSGVAYSWSGPGNFTSGSSNPSVSTIGTYTLTVTNPANGCNSSATTTVTQNVIEPGATANETGTLTCNATSASLSGSSPTSGVTYSWAGPNSYSSTAQNPAVDSSGTYTLTVKDPVNGCTSTANTIVPQNTTAPGASSSVGGPLTCAITSVTLIGNSTTTGVSYSWVGPNSFTSVLKTPSVNTIGTYNLTVTDPINGCTSTVTINVTQNLNPPGATAAASGSITCTNSSVILSGTSSTTGVSYSWTGPNNFTSSLQNPVVNTIGTYNLTVTNPANNCNSTTSVNVTLNTTAPGATAGVSSPLTCATTSVNLSGSSGTSGVTYAWTGPSNFISASQNPAVNAPGAYSLTVTNPVNGCTSNATINVVQNSIPPDVNATVSGNLTCVATSVKLSGNSSISGVTYTWSGSNSFSSTSKTPTVSTVGTYTLTITNPADGCTNSKSIQVVSNTGATGTLWHEDFPHCDGTVADDGITSWAVQNSGTGTFAVCSNKFKVTGIGTSGQGVWTSGTINISGKSNVVISADIRSAVSGSAVMNTSGTYLDYIRFYYKLNGGLEVLFNEKLGGINSNSSNYTNVSVGSLSGTTLQIIIKARASGSDEFYYFDNVKVTGTGQVDVSASVSGSLTCTATSVSLLGNSSVTGATYKWSGPNSFSSTLQNPVVSAPGTYTVTVTDPSNGCTSSTTASVTQTISVPGATAGVSGQLSCTVASVTLSGSSPTSGVTYSWSGSGGFTSTLQNPSVNTLGTYTLTVTDPLNECTSAASVEVTAAAPSPATTFWFEDLTFANGATSDAGTTSWSSSTSGSGTFSVQNNEFKASFNSGNSSEGVWTSSVINIAAKSNVVASVDLRSETASTSDYLETSDYINVYYKLDGGAETLIYGDVAGLGSTTNTTATAIAISPALNGSTLQIIIRLKNTDPTERYYFDNIKLTGSDQTVGTITTFVSGSVTCPNPNVQIGASVTNPIATYYWIRPDNTTISQQNPIVSTPGNYTVVVSIGGCQASKTVTVGGSTQIPDVTVSGDHLACSSNVPALLTAVSSKTNLTYAWGGSSGFTSTSKNPSVLNSGTYTVTVTDKSNLCTNFASFSVQFGTLVWNEDFEGLADETIEDLGNTAWNVDNSKLHTVDLSSYSGESGLPYYFEVWNNKLAAKSTRGEVVWTSKPIAISGIGQLFARLDISGEGTLNDETDCGKDCFDYDYVKVFYKIDGGAETPFANLGSIPGKMALSNIKASSNIPNGNTMQIVIKAYNTGNNEILYFDNIQVLALGQGGGQVTASVNGPLTCKDTLVKLTASPNIAGVSYNWTGPNGFTSDQYAVDVNQPGVYMLIVSGNTGCVTSDTVSVSVAQDIARPDSSINSSGILTCANTQVTLTSNASNSGLAYSWTGPGNYISALKSIIVSTGGTYTLNITNPANGCKSIASKAVDQNTTLPGASAIGGKITCARTSVILTGSSGTDGVTYNWSGPESFTSNTQNPTVINAGIYTLSVSNALNGCISMDTAIVSLDNTVPGANGIGGKLTCTKTSVTLTGSSSTSGVTYSWSGPSFTSTAQNPTVSAAGTYTVTVTNPVNGCVSTDTAMISQNITVPGANGIGGKLTCTKTSVTLTGSSSTSGVTYSWSGPSFTSTAQNPTVSNAGTYTVMVTNPVNGCISTDTAMVSQNITVPGANGIGGGLTCTKTSVTLTGSSSTSGVTYSWSGPSFTSTAQNPTVNAAGTYTVTVTNPVNGCISTDTAMVSQNITVPGANGIGGKLTCTKTSVILTGSSSTSGVTYSWSGPSFTSTAQNPTVAAAGTYTVTVTNPVNGCVSTDTAMVSQNITLPGANGLGGKLTCTKTSVILTGSSSTSGVTYSWSGPSFTSTAQNPTVSAAGTYTVTVTNPVNGCVSTDTAIVSQNITLPGANGIGGKLTCTKTSVTLTGSSSTSGVTYSWSGPSFTSTAQNPTVISAGTYTVTVTNPVNGCTSTDTAIVSQNIETYIATAIGGFITCANSSITLSGNSSGSRSIYSWTGPGSVTSAVQNPIVTGAGIYTLTVTNQDNGCTSTDTAMVTLNNTKPGASAGVSTVLTCNATSVTLTGSSPTSEVTYSWSGPLNFASTEQNPVTTHTGTYTITVTNPANGCNSTSSVPVLQDTTTASGVTTSVSGMLTCMVNNVTVAGSSSTTEATYSWTGPDSYSSNSQSIVVSTPGNYILHVSKPSNGCVITTNAVVFRDTIKPVVTITSSGIISCTASSVTLTGSSTPSGVSYAWSGPSFTATGAVANVTNPGTYSVTVTNPGNNCSTSTSVTVVKDLTQPSGVAASVSGILTCSSPNVIISATSATSGVVYNWTGPVNYTSNESAPHVSNPGTYIVTVTDPYNNCSITKSVDVSQNIAVPEGVIVSVSDILSCYNASVTISGSSTTAGVTYSWTGPGGYISDQQEPIVDVAGTYTLKVASSTNGCTTAMPVIVEQDTTPPADVLASVSGTLNCRTLSIILSGSSSTQGVDYEWDAPNGNFITSNPNVAVNSPGTYTLIVTNFGNGCSKQKTATVVSDKALPISSIIPPSGSPVALTNNTLLAQAVTNASYLWGFSSTNSNWSIVSGGASQEMTYQAGDAGSSATYSLTVTNNGNGCSKTSQIGLTAVSSLKSVPILSENVEDAGKIFSFKAYPNPFMDKATLEIAPLESSHMIVELHSGSGKLEGILFDSDVQSSQLYKITIDGEKMQAGTYYIIIRTNGHVYSQKIIFVN